MALKSVLALSIALWSLAAPTVAVAAEKYVCSRFDRTTGRLLQNTVALHPLESGDVIEGVPLKYAFELYDGPSVTPSLRVEGTVVTEDVIFRFTSYDGKVRFNIFLEELNESNLTLDGDDGGGYVCY